MLLTTGERVTAALLTMALADLGIDAVSFTGSQVGIITDTVPPQGQDRRGQGRPRPRGARRRQGRRHRRLPGREHRQGDHHDGSWRVGPHRLGARQGARRRRLRDLHRRHRRVHRRPAHRAAGPQAGRGSASTRCSRWPAPVPRCWPCARSSSPATTTSPSTSARRSRGNPARGSPTNRATPEVDGRSDHLRCRHRHDRGQGHRARRARPPRHLGRAVRAARRGQRQRRHDRAEHLDRRHDRHQLHDAVGRHGRRRGHRQPHRPRRSAPPASPTTTTSPRCRSSAPA